MEFDEYFLTAQSEGNEVYLGDNAVLVVYEDRGIVVQTTLPTLLYDAVFCDAEMITGSVLEARLKEIRKPENRRGKQPELTGKIIEIWTILTQWHEDNDPGKEFDILGRYNPCRF